MNPANLTDTAEVTVPLTDQILQQLAYLPQAVGADGNTTGGAAGGIAVAAAGNTTEGTVGDTTECVFSQTGGSGFSPVPHGRVPVNTQNTDYTEYRVPVSLPVPQNVSLPVPQNLSLPVPQNVVVQ